MAVTRKTQKDIGNYEAKLIGPFTTRQCILLGIGAVPTIIACVIINRLSSDPYAMIGGCIFMIIPGFFAFGKNLCYQMNPEDFIAGYYYYHIKCPNRRLYKTKTLDDEIEENKYKEELKSYNALSKAEKKKTSPPKKEEMTIYPHKESDIRSFL